MLNKVDIQGVRNLSQVSFPLSPTGNLFFGRNGSGKTSVLEALHLLSLGRSFRTASAKPLIQFERDFCVVRGELFGQRPKPIAIQRFRSGDARAKLDGSFVQSISELASELPVVLIDPDALGLITGQPEGRRRFLDGCVFHVEHAFLDAWRRYQRALKQRNASLRHGTLAGDEAWLNELSESGQQLTKSRQKTLDRLSEAFREIAVRLSPDVANASLSLRCGWDSESSLLDALKAATSVSIKQGFTHVGPHRADLKVSVDGRPASEVLSRGQLKLTVAALKLAQGKLLQSGDVTKPVFLVDDLVAELDELHATSVCRELFDTGAQVLMTAVDSDLIASKWPSDLKMFHVEHGQVEVCTT